MWFGLLGPLEIVADGRRVRLGGPRQEKILAALLLAAGRVVSVDRLVGVVWAEDAPATAARQIRNVTNTLRRQLLDDGAPPHVITASGPGFVANLDGSRCDLREFELHLSRAEFAERMSRTTDAVSELRAALALWRGPVLSGLDSAALAPAATGLDERRLAVLDRRYTLELAAAPDGVDVTELAELVGRHPLHAAFVGHLMTARYRAGRHAEALSEYRQLYARLDAQGMHPPAELHTLYQRILRQDPALRNAGAEHPRPSPDEQFAAFADALSVTLPRDDPAFRSRALFEFADRHRKSGRLAEARADLAQALTITRAANDTYGVSRAAGKLAAIHAQLGEHRLAIDYATEALAAARRCDVPRATADALLALATAHTAAGDHPPAIGYLERAVAAAAESGARDVQAAALNALGRANAARGDHTRARDCFQHALRLAREIDSMSQEIRADHGLHKYPE
ncbi:BTAD domain-containing putative transcriptional regulator [Actinophytocola sediminis]